MTDQKQIDGFRNYFINTDGDVLSLQGNGSFKKLKQCSDLGYKCVVLCVSGIGTKKQVHRLLAQAFIPLPDLENVYQVDHINGDRSDNRLSNLRWATHSENMRNSKMRSNNTSGVKGVSWQKRRQKWQAIISINAKPKFLGYFDNKDDAIVTINEARNKYYGEFQGASV